MKLKEYIAMVLGGVVFGFGLAYSGAAIPEVALSFLRLEDFGLLLVMGGGLLLTALTLTFIPRVLKTSLFGHPFTPKASASVTQRTIVGASIFGIGWGLTGLCPGTSFAGVGMGNLPILYGIAGMFFGAFIYGRIRSQK
jgi:uncharacterized membrane protein YedE/YeeE